MKQKKLYMLSSGKKPVAYQIQSSHRVKRPLLISDPETGTVRELRYATNMASPFIDEQEGKGTPTIAHIWFRDGVLAVNENDVPLQNFLAVHPHNEANGGTIFYEYNPDRDAQEEVENLEAAAAAMSLAKDIDINDASAVVYQSVGSRISQYTSSEIRRDLLSMALNQPQFLLNALEDETVKLDWIAHQAIAYEIVSVVGSQIKLGKSTKSLLTVKPGLDAEEALSKFFLTDDGIAALEEIKTRLNKLLK